ncbi:unnamed protein product, partial [Clonostachys byssicola]
MYFREPKPKRRNIIKMDPDCAICGAPAEMACECEAKGLDVAMKQAEDKVMKDMYFQIRQWVRSHAQDHILDYFRMLSDQRKTQHSEHLDQLTNHAYHYYNAPPHPQHLADAQRQLKEGIDEDWKASVELYPEVLEYFFNLVELSLPSNDDPVVSDPPFKASPQRKPPQRRVGPPPGTGGGAPGGPVGGRGGRGGGGGGGGPGSAFYENSQAVTPMHYGMNGAMNGAMNGPMNGMGAMNGMNGRMGAMNGMGAMGGMGGMNGLDPAHLPSRTPPPPGVGRHDRHTPGPGNRRST